MRKKLLLLSVLLMACGPDIDLADENVNGQLVISNAVVDPNTGRLEFVVINTFFGDETRLIPLPLNQFRWDASLVAFILTAQPELLERALFFKEGFSTGPSRSGWQEDFFDYWR